MVNDIKQIYIFVPYFNILIFHSCIKGINMACFSLTKKMSRNTNHKSYRHSKPLESIHVITKNKNWIYVDE